MMTVFPRTAILRRAWRLPAYRLLVAMALLVAGPILGQADDAPVVTLGEITIEPAQPSADTLCKLTVEVRNASDKTVSALDFKVDINGKSVKIYETQLLYEPIEPGETRALRLHNFWTTETHRPAVDGKLELEVTLEAAQWMQIENKTEDGREIEEWTPLGEVPGLPLSVQLSKKLGG
jgi:hypothetical protein